MKNTVNKIAKKLEKKGLFKTIQYILYGKQKNVMPNVCKW